MKRYGRNQKRQARAELASAQATIVSQGKRLDRVSLDLAAMNDFAGLVEHSLGRSFSAFKAERATPIFATRLEPTLRLPRFIHTGPLDYTRDLSDVMLMVDYIDELEVMQCSAELDRLRGMRFVRIRLGEHDTVSYALSRWCFKGWSDGQVVEHMAQAMAELMVTTPIFRSVFMENS
jgi:hypothetical protein